MRPVSAAFLSAVTGSHTMAVRARVVAPGQSGTDPDGTLIPALDGDVQLDAGADIRSTLELVTAGAGMWPRRATDLLAPYGNELFIERGVQLGGGTTEWCSLGYFRINTPEQARIPDGPIRIQGTDRMAGIIDARLTEPRQFDSADTLGNIVDTLVGEVYPGATIDWDDATDTEQLGRSLICDEDRHAFLNDLIVSRGKTWYWDYRGHLLIKDPPDPGTPVLTVSHGAGGVLVEMSRQLTREGVYNGVVAYGEAADTQAPVRAVVVDLAASSPTRWGGPFGQVPRFYSSPFIVSADQAASAAAAILRQQLGLPYNVDFGMIVNPALEPHDPIKIRFPGGFDLHVLQRLTIPLTATAAQTATTREKTIVLIGTP